MFVGNLWVCYEADISSLKFINLKYLIDEEAIGEHDI